MDEIALHILDLMENSIRAKASLVHVTVEENSKENLLTVLIEDNGKGMTPQEVQCAFDPFYTTRKERPVGLGLSLWHQVAQTCGGKVDISSEVGKGTRLSAVFDSSHIDLAPMGDIPGSLTIFLAGNPQIDFVYRHEIDNQVWQVDTREIRRLLGDDVPLDYPPIVKWFREYCQGNYEKLQGRDQCGNIRGSEKD